MPHSLRYLGEGTLPGCYCGALMLRLKLDFSLSRKIVNSKCRCSNNVAKQQVITAHFQGTIEYLTAIFRGNPIVHAQIPTREKE